MEYRKATTKDIAHLVELRKKQLLGEGMSPARDIDAELHSFFTDKMADGSLINWLAVDGHHIIATASILFYDFPPTYAAGSGKKGYVTNMYTEPEYRKQGIAFALLSNIVDEARNAGVTRLFLSASDLGRPVYERIGFLQSDRYMEMSLD